MGHFCTYAWRHLLAMPFWMPGRKGSNGPLHPLPFLVLPSVKASFWPPSFPPPPYQAGSCGPFDPFALDCGLQFCWLPCHKTACAFYVIFWCTSFFFSSGSMPQDLLWRILCSGSGLFLAMHRVLHTSQDNCIELSLSALVHVRYIYIYTYIYRCVYIYLYIYI